MNAYVELHCHSNFSFLDGASHPWELARRAADLEMPALALTDRGGVYGAVRFVQSCQAFGVRPLLGAALEVDGEEIVLLAKNLRGWSNLCRLCSLGHRDQPKGEARTTLATAAQHRGDLLYLTATRDEPRLRALQEALGRDAVFLELRNQLRAEDPWLLEEQAELGARCQTPTVVTNDVHYHHRDRRSLHDVLTAIRNRATLEEIHGQLPPNSEQVLKAGDELRPLFRGHEDALARTAELAQECRLSELDFRRVRFPGYPVREGKTPFSFIYQLCLQGARQRYHPITPAVARRLQKELDVIEKTGPLLARSDSS